LTQQDVPGLQLVGEVLEELRPAWSQGDPVIDVASEADDLANGAVGLGVETDADVVEPRSEQRRPARSGVKAAYCLGGECHPAPVHVVVGQHVACTLGC
jgi:hypothetical protein